MKIGTGAALAGALFGIGFAALGCTGATDVSTQPSQSEIEAGKQRRLAEIDKLNAPEEAKQRMRAQIGGGNPAQPDQAQARQQGLQKNGK